MSKPSPIQSLVVPSVLCDGADESDQRKLGFTSEPQPSCGLNTVAPLAVAKVEALGLAIFVVTEWPADKVPPRTPFNSKVDEVPALIVLSLANMKATVPVPALATLKS